MSDLLKPCVTCGEVSEKSRCEEHRPKDTRVDRRRDTGSATWINLSKRARKIQPFCQLCGATEDLQADHSPRAWAREAARKALRLCDVTVLCGGCNSNAGSSMPDSERYKTWAAIDGDINATTTDTTLTPWGMGDPSSHPAPTCKAKFRTDTPRGYTREGV